MKRILLVLLSISFALPAAEQSPQQSQKPSMARLVEFPQDIQSLISKFALGQGTPDYQALANIITAMGNLITSEKLISIFESLPNNIALSLVSYLRHLPIINDKKVQAWIKEQELLAAAKTSDLPDMSKIATILADKNINVNVKDKMFGRSALIWASRFGHKELVRLLLEAGASVNEKDRAGWTALTMANEWGRIEIMKLLLAAGADPSIKNTAGRTVLNEVRFRMRHLPEKVQEYNEIIKLLQDAEAAQKVKGMQIGKSSHKKTNLLAQRRN